MKNSEDHLKNLFFKLTADKVLDSVESSMATEKPGIRATGRVLALNSLENRVYEVEFEDDSKVVAKFYRPERWNQNQIAEEHQFLAKLHEIEVPVVSPLSLVDSKHSKLTKQRTLAETADQILFAVFPKVRGRLVDELSKIQLETLGRYTGRIHRVGGSWPVKHRLKLTAEIFGWKPLDLLLDSGFLDAQTEPHYESLAVRLIELAEAKLEHIPLIAVHGDCHVGNILWSGDAPFFLDFDDMLLAPAVQDIWMIIRGRDEEARKQREVLLSTYEQMNHFDYESLDLIEVLRGLRIIHYSAWIAARWEDPSFPKAFPDFGSPSYWRSELEALMEICDLIEGGGRGRVD